MENKAQRIKAGYREECSFYKGNPYAEALPPIPDSRKNTEKLLDLPVITQDDRDRSDYERVTMLGALRRFNFPMPRAEELMVDIYSLIKQRYIGLNPLKDEDLAQMRKLEKEIKEEYEHWKEDEEALNREIEENEEKEDEEITSQNYEKDSDFYNTTAENMLFVGISGIGKTSALKRMLWFLPDVIQHTEYKGKRLIRTQIPVLHIETPYQGGEKELCFSILQAFDDRLGNTHYYKDGKKSGVTTVELTIRVGKLCQIFGVGLLIFDEAQNLIRKGTRSGGKRFQGFILFATNVWGTPFVLTGTPKLEKLFKSNFRTLRRICSFGAVKWERLENGRLFRKFVEAMWKLQLTRTESPLTDEIVDVLYSCSQGIVQMIVSVFLRTQRNVILNPNNPDEIITPQAILQTFNRDFVPVHKAIEAIKRNDYSAMEDFGDIMTGLDESFRTEDKASDKQMGIIEQELKKRQRENSQQAILDALYDCRKSLCPSLSLSDLKNISKLIINQAEEGCQVSHLIALATGEAINMNAAKTADTKERLEKRKFRKNKGILAAGKFEAGKYGLEEKGFIGEKDEFS